MPPVGARASRGALPQQLRLLCAIAYFVALLGLARYLNGTFWPPYGLDGLWFYSAAAALLLGEFVLEPFFTRPVDAMASGITILIAAATTSVAGAEISPHAARIGRIAVIALAATVLIVAVIAISFKDTGGIRGRTAARATALTSRLSRARWLFSALLFGSGFAAFAHSSGRIAALYLTWFAIIVLAPLESGVELLVRQRAGRPVKHGTVEALDDPGTIVARLPEGSLPALGGEVELEESGALGTIVELTQLSEQPRIRVALADSRPVRIGSGIHLTGKEAENPIIGHVAEGTSLEELAIATVPVAAAVGLEEGRLVEAEIGGTPTLYQVVAAEIVPRSEGDLRRHLVRVAARKLGRWNAERTVFEPIAWVPAPGSSVRLLMSVGEPPFDEEAVGHVPGTSYGVGIDPHLAVTHNTAILGILGIGKTFLAWELIKRMLAAEIKVVALDITGRYSDHFADLCSADTESRLAVTIEERIAANVANRNVRNNEAGNIDDFQQALGELLQSFADGDERLLILNPNRFDVTRMEGKPFSGQANMLARVTMVEITRMISERLLELLQARPRDPRDESANLCLVLEEAHSLVPEWNSATNEAERQAVNGTARAVLQGRKYGFGCLLVTQRTANITKSILNQCNTVFGMRVYDATGMGFLENYIGPTYAQLLASLRDRQAVVFGRASSCNSPLIIDLNDGVVLQERYWATKVAAIPPTRPPEVEEPGLAAELVDGTAPTDDDIPF
jgi:hypothetical protein